MSKKQLGPIQVLKKHKAKLITILSNDPDLVLQHADSQSLVSPEGYGRIKACRTPSEQVRDLLDHVTGRGPETAHGFLKLLKVQKLQKAFPMLKFIKNIKVNMQSSGKQTSRKRKQKRNLDVEDTTPPKQAYNSSSPLVTEEQLMTVARATGDKWTEIGIMALGISSVKLEQITADKRLHVERVFKMLCLWRNCQRDEATVAHLHSLLSRKDLALPKESFDFLLETNKCT